jgi:hypothetical protein
MASPVVRRSAWNSLLACEVTEQESCGGFYSGISDRISDPAASFWRACLQNVAAANYETFWWIDPRFAAEIKH